MSRRQVVKAGLLAVYVALPGCASANRLLVTPDTWNAPTDWIEVTRTGLRIGSGTLELPTDEASLVLLLGPHDRSVHGKNRILVWDRLGIFAYQQPDTAEIDALTVSFSCVDADFCPKTGYPGVVVIGNAVFRGVPEPRDFIRYRFRADEFFCFKNRGKYQVSVPCIEGGPSLGTFEIALRD